MKIVGADISINGTGISMGGEKYYFQNPSKWAIVAAGKIDDIHADRSIPHVGNGMDSHRYFTAAGLIANSMLSWTGGEPFEMAVEGYAYGYAYSGDVSRVMDIADFCGMVKYAAISIGARITVYTPSEVKKFATGRGDASKVLMVSAFMERWPSDPVTKLIGAVGPDRRFISPVADLVDARWIMELHSSRLSLLP